MYVSIEKRREEGRKERSKKGKSWDRVEMCFGDEQREEEGVEERNVGTVEFGDISFEATNEGEREKEKRFEKKRFLKIGHEVAGKLNWPILYTFVEPTRLPVEGSKKEGKEKMLNMAGTNFAGSTCLLNETRKKQQFKNY